MLIVNLGLTVVVIATYGGGAKMPDDAMIHASASASAFSYKYLLKLCIRKGPHLSANAAKVRRRPKDLYAAIGWFCCAPVIGQDGLNSLKSALDGALELYLYHSIWPCACIDRETSNEPCGDNWKMSITHTI